MTIFETPELRLHVVLGNELLGSVWQRSCKIPFLCSAYSICRVLLPAKACACEPDFELLDHSILS